MDEHKLNDVDMDDNFMLNPDGEGQIANNKSSNVLQFYPYINNTLTRSVGTLNLSLSNVNLSIVDKEEVDESQQFQDQKHRQEHGDVDSCINDWSPFNESLKDSDKRSNNDFDRSNVTKTPINLKRTVSKSELSPFIKDPNMLKKINYKTKNKNNLDPSRLISSWNAKKNNEFNDGIDIDISSENDNTNSYSDIQKRSFIGAKPDQSIFKSDVGLKSKIATNKNGKGYLKKLDVPDTPIKKSPLLENRMFMNRSNNSFTNLNFFPSILESPEIDSTSNKENIIHNSKKLPLLYSQSPTNNKKPRIFINDSSPLNKYYEKSNKNDDNNDNDNDVNLDDEIDNKYPDNGRNDTIFVNKNFKKVYLNDFDSDMNKPPSAESAMGNSLAKFQSKYKKIKKSRNSVIFQNNELTNSLQQFTDDLYGPVGNFFNAPTSPPVSFNLDQQTIKPRNTKDGHSTNSSNSSNHSSDANIINNSEASNTTPTNHKRIAGSTIIKPPQLYDLINSSPTSKFTSPIRTRRLANKIEINPDSHLLERFVNVSTIGDGQFSKVFQVTFEQTNKKYAVKSIQLNKYNSLKRILQEIKILSEISNDKSFKDEGKEHVLSFISSWKHLNCFYVMTEFCENGNLDQFIQEQIIAKNSRLEDWRIWKIIVELCLALRYIHNHFHIIHLDIKPANVMITFEGTLKLGDFGMATHLPLEDTGFENEGDVEYIAPEIISDSIYDYRADIFSLGLLIVEIATNVVLPDNGNAWHKLRSGDLSDAGRLSSTDIHSNSLFSNPSKVDTTSTELSTFITKYNKSNNGDRHLADNATSKIPPWVPRFLIYGESLERIVKWMIEPNYKKRPTAEQILHTEECIYVEMTRKAGAVIQEDDYGPKPNFLTLENDYYV